MILPGTGPIIFIRIHHQKGDNPNFFNYLDDVTDLLRTLQLEWLDKNGPQ